MNRIAQKVNIEGRACHHVVHFLNILVNLLDIKTYLEIGVHNGTSMSYVVSSPKQIDCFGIDLFDEGPYKRDKLDIDRTISNIQSNNKGQSKINLIKGNSHNLETIDELAKRLNGNLVDLFFIDGDHGFEGVKKDFLNYEGFVKVGGVIVFDDYNSRWPGVVKFANSIDTKKFEIIGLYGDNELAIKKTE